MTGNGSGDTLYGGAGNDELYGGEGNDTLYGGDGNDEINTGLGNDYAYGGSGDDDINGYLTPEGEYDYLYWTSSGAQWLYGNAGNDTVIGGSGVDNIEGGTGNDYLYGQEGDDVINGAEGKDTLYGDEGNDTLSGGDGNDDLYGWDGNDALNGGIGDDYIEGWIGEDIITGGEGNDTLYGDAGNDIIFADGGSDTIQGGTGIDTIKYNFSRLNYTLTLGEGNSTVKEKNTGTNDTFSTIERVVFSDKTVAIDIGVGEIGGSCYRIYKAAFNRTPDKNGLGFWIGQMDLGTTLVEVSAGFIDSDEFRTSYGTNPTNGEFLTKVYNNVLSRDPDSGGYDWWVDQLANNPEKSWDKVLADFSESSENVENTESLISNGISYDLWIA
jgi:Ca2+-binding RTX toxin-like protein